MSSILQRVAALCVALATALFVSGCSESSTDQHAGHDQTKTAESAEVTDHNADDVAFAQNMMPHHQQAIEMAAIAQGASENPRLRDLAGAIIMSQSPEIDIFREWLSRWGTPESPDSGEHGDHGPAAMHGMIDQATMDRMQTLRGPEFDRLWLESMVAHHEGAIEMAKAEIANGKNADAIAIAKTIIADQQAELDRMKQMLGG